MSVRARKRFAQHFLKDRNIINKIIDHLNLDASQTLIEIGPGMGALTFPLLDSIDTQLHVIEIDIDLADYLQSQVKEPNKLMVHREDALKIDFCKVFKGQLNIIGNLPYNISTPLLFHTLDHICCIDQMLFMLQKEVADRITADPGSRAYGRLSVMVQSVCQAESLFDVAPGSFIPPPKVESSVIRLVPDKKAGNDINTRETFSNIVRAAFTKRRKTIRNALKGLVSETDLESCGIDPGTRPEQVSVELYLNLARIITGNDKSTS
jgi:16S rRNA (adenine1518-N6/adenine1519-N6)-dimethyltransferase